MENDCTEKPGCNCDDCVAETHDKWCRCSVCVRSGNNGKHPDALEGHPSGCRCSECCFGSTGNMDDMEY